MRLKRLLLNLAISSILFALFACGDSSPIIVGFSGQLTGKQSDLGVFGRNGVILAVEKINATEGINGRPLKLIAINDLNTPEGALDADKKLLKAGAVAIIGHMTSSQTMAVMPFVNETGIVMVSPTASTPKLSQKADSFFRTMVENPIQSNELADYARSALDINTVLTVAELDNKSYSFSFRDGFTQKFEEMGGEIIKNITYSSSSSSNWDAIIDTLVASKPDAILLTIPAQDMVSIVQRIRTMGLKTRVLSGAWAYTDKLLKWGGTFTEGIIFVIDYAADNPNPGFIKFREAYKNRFGSNPNFASAFSYEATLALAEALKKTDGSAKGLADAMAPSDAIDGVISAFKLDEFGDVERNVFIVTVQEGEFRTVEMR